MFLKALFTAIAFYLVSIGASFGLEDTGPKCGSFVLVGAEKQAAVIDNPPAGKSIGDVRAGSRALVDESGNPIGKVHYVATLTAPGSAGHGDVLASQYFVTLPGGWVASASLYELVDAADTSQKAGSATLVVTGGSGPYAGATGTISIEPGEAPRYVFELNCK